jgi:3'-phosphoadenosine 5'-phosphosulfate sulfotransferase (PAPS reductase)/FAD synthetase
VDKSRDIVQGALAEYKPAVTVALVSGGTDSLTAYYVARHLQVPVDYIVHIHTGTGIPQTTEFVRKWAREQDAEYIEGSAGTAYQDYVLRKGFFGRGLRAHSYAYHVLKAHPLRKAMSSIRQRRRGFPILMLTGIRLDESENRKYNFAGKTCRPDPAAQSNIFCNLIEHWTKRQCLDYLRSIDAPRNPVADLLHRSGECMCGTMQSDEDRQEAALWYPEWGAWLDRLEAKVCENFPAKWGQETTRRAGTAPIELGICQGCQLRLIDL